MSSQTEAAEVRQEVQLVDVDYGDVVFVGEEEGGEALYRHPDRGGLGKIWG